MLVIMDRMDISNGLNSLATCLAGRCGLWRWLWRHNASHEQAPVAGGGQGRDEREAISSSPRHCSRPPPRVLVVLDMIWAARAGHASRGSRAASGMYQWYSADTMHDASPITRAGLTSTARSYELLTGRIASCGCLRVCICVSPCHLTLPPLAL
jgi:hypothetical protein